jgi:hypothetical protein
MEPSRVISATIFMQPSKSVSSEMVIAPLARGWINWAIETLSFGRKTIDGIPAAALYAESAADVSPVEAQATARTFERI